jgi:hypothetical protein
MIIIGLGLASEVFNCKQAYSFIIIIISIVDSILLFLPCFTFIQLHSRFRFTSSSMYRSIASVKIKLTFLIGKFETKRMPKWSNTQDPQTGIGTDQTTWKYSFRSKQKHADSRNESTRLGFMFSSVRIGELKS